MKEKILELRTQGLSYNDIASKLGCSKGTISYHCGENQKIKTLERTRLGRTTITGILAKKWSTFLNIKLKPFNRNKIIKKDKGSVTGLSLLNMIGINPTCYLTGDSIDLLSKGSYHFDHIMPRNKGGESTLENLGICTKEANQSKTHLTLEEYLILCEKVLKKHKPELLK